MSLTKLTKLVSKTESIIKILKCSNANKVCYRCYSIEPPEWLGGKSMFDFSGQYDFPEHSKSFDQRIKEISAEELSKNPKKEVKNIGKVVERVEKNEDDLQKIIMTNKNNKELERIARLKQLTLPLEEVRADWWQESGPPHVTSLAHHCGIFKHLFDDNFFHPTVDLKVHFDYDEDLVTPVYHGNILTPSDAQSAPHVSFHASPGSVWTLLMVNPDESLTEQHLQHVHWMVCNIPGAEVSKGDTVVSYMPPIPASGTGFHRNVLILLEQEGLIQKQPCIPPPDASRGILNLHDRLFSTTSFLTTHSSLTPRGLAFFQAEWDESVRKYYREVLGMGEPVFEYDWPTAYHPPPKKYPHKEPFNLYFDRYRDKKDIGEEVLRLKMQTTHPFREPGVDSLSYPLAHKPLHYKPSWLRQKEELMVRRVEQFADLD